MTAWIAHAGLEGTWQGAGTFHSNRTLKESCPHMSITISSSGDQFNIAYYFACQSFEFVDELNLIQHGSEFFQNDAKVGELFPAVDGQDQFRLSLEDVHFQHSAGSLGLQAQFDLQQGKLNYSDQFTYHNGRSDFFEAAMKKQ